MNVAPWYTCSAQIRLAFPGPPCMPVMESSSFMRYGHHSPGISEIIRRRLGYFSNVPWNSNDQIRRRLWYADSMNRSRTPSPSGQ